VVAATVSTDAHCGGWTRRLSAGNKFGKVHGGYLIKCNGEVADTLSGPLLESRCVPIWSLLQVTRSERSAHFPHLLMGTVSSILMDLVISLWTNPCGPSGHSSFVILLTEL
jgi:hypothetical protein